jgi:hypothetical protein
MHSTGDKKTFGEPDKWEFDYPWDIVQTGFWLWAMSGFQKLPTQDEVQAYDPRFISDMRLAHLIYSHQGNSSPLMKLFENWMQFQENPEAFAKDQAQQSETTERDDSKQSKMVDFNKIRKK